ncbi:MAG: MBL fold metallo-hydrolase [Ruminiclostridium sp.]|nr:MBL fold metallo-hydrolase [Ruminiclostridium sp.]
MKKLVTNSGYTIYQVLSGRSNVFLITNGKDNLLVDTSTKRNYRRLDKALKDLDCNNISLLILTHAHFDHTANASLIKEKYSPEIVVHLNDKDFLETGNNPLPQGTNFLTRFFVNIFGKRLSPFVKYDSVKSDVIIKDNYDLKEYGFNAYIIHTPGHTLGSISVIVDGEIAIVGDAMFGVFKKSVFPPFADNPIKMIDSWSKLLDTGCKVFLPSHGTETGKILLESQYKKYKKKYT